jgi:O-antigen/teichoic acid export membrane protein
MDKNVRFTDAGRVVGHLEGRSRSRFAMNAPHKKAGDSLVRRFAFRLSSSVIGTGLSILTQPLVLRGLGPASFGAFGFLTHFFTQAVNLLDSGTSTGFLSKLSQRPDDEKMKLFYGLYVISASALIMIFVLAALVLGLGRALWPEQPPLLVWLGVAWGILYWQNLVTEKLIHVYGLTVRGEILRAWQQLLSLPVLAALYQFGRLNIINFFICEISLFVFLQIGWFMLLYKSGDLARPTSELTLGEARVLGEELYVYSKPMLIGGFISIGAALFERWGLQRFGGSIEQGQYTLSFQIAAAFSLVTGSLSPLLIRDLSASLVDQNKSRARDIFTRALPLTYWVGAYFGIFCSFQASEIARILGGESYRGAVLAIRIMGIYPALQACGSLNSALFLSSGRTKTYADISNFITLLGLPISFFLLAPSRMLGYNLGAEGLAIKIITVTFLSNQLLLWSNARFLGIEFKKYLFFQIHTLAPLILSAWVAGKLAQNFFAEQFAIFFSAGAIYTAIASILLLTKPEILGLEKTVLDPIYVLLRTRLRINPAK